VPRKKTRRASIGRRFRLFFRFDSNTRIIIFAWVNNEHNLRSSGARTEGAVVRVRKSCPAAAGSIMTTRASRSIIGAKRRG